MAEHTDSSFYVTGGTLRHDAPSYVERQADWDLLDGLLKGEFCYVLTSRQMGKSSLMVRTAGGLREQGVHVVVLDLTAIGQNLTPEQWYNGLMVRMGRHLDLEDGLENFWDEHPNLGPCQRLFTAIRDVVLGSAPVPGAVSGVSPDTSGGGRAPFGQRASPVPLGGTPSGATGTVALPIPRVVIFVDEIDVVRSLPFSTDEFFAAIRECYNRRTEDAHFNRLTFCLLGVASPSDLVRDTRLTPFNIGRRVVLSDFSVKEAMPLTMGLQEAKPEITNAHQLLERILHWTGGHPYLTQRLCQALAQALTRPRSETDIRPINPGLQTSPPPAPGPRKPRLRGRPTPMFVDELCEDLFLSNRAREQDDNLLFVRERMLRSEADRAALLHSYEDVLSGKSVADDETNPFIGVLRLSGIARVVAGRLYERNRIYERVFDRTWVRANMPDAEVRRQRAAFRRGVVRTAAVATAVVLGMAVMVVITVRKSLQAERASAQAYVSQAEATLVSGLQGQRFRALAAIERAAPIYTNRAALRDLDIGAMALVDLQNDRRWAGWPEGTTAAAACADFRLYARGSREGSISVRSLTNDAEVLALAGSGVPVQLLMFSPNGRYLAAKCGPGATNKLVVWDWRAQKAALSLTEEVSGEAVDFSPDSGRLAVGLSSGAIEVRALDSGERISRIPLRLASQRPRAPNCARFDPSGNRLAESSPNSLHVQVWDLKNGRLTNSFYHRAPVLWVDWHPEGELLATACKDGAIYLWDLRSPLRACATWRGHEAEVVALAFNHQGDVLASHGADKALRLWVPATGRQVRHFVTGEPIAGLIFSADDRRLGLYRSGAELQTWEVNPAREYRTLVDYASITEEIEGVDMNPDGTVLAAATSGGILLWDPVRGRKLGEVPLATVRSVCFHPTSGDLLASSGEGVHRWTLPAQGETVHLSRAMIPGLEGLGKMAVSLDGRTAAVIRQNTVHVFEPDKAGQQTKLVSTNHYRSIALSPDGKYLAGRVVEGSAEVHIWDMASQERVKNAPRLSSGPHFMFSPDGKWFCTCPAEDYALWEVGTWSAGPRLRQARTGNQPGVMAFSSDGKMLAVARAPAVIELLELPQLETLARLESPDRRPLLDLAFSHDGRRLAAAGLGHLIMIWDLGLIRDQLDQFKLAGRFPAKPSPATGPGSPSAAP